MSTRRVKADERAAEMAALFRQGWTYERIGQRYGVSRQRIQQLLGGRCGITAADGGATLRYALKRRARDAEKRARRDARCLSKYGCTYALYHSTPVSARRAFRQQRANARRRDIEMSMTFWEWWTLWQESGHWEKRGVGQGFVMCRYKDAGPYAIGNVYIATARHNVSTRQNRVTDLPMGVSRNGKKFTAQRCFNGQVNHLGSFPTAALAHAAYLNAFPSDNKNEVAA